MPCDRCGHTHPRCAAHRRDGQPCTQWPVDAADKCRMHIGKSAKVHKRQTAAARAVATYGLPVDVDPHDALLEEIARTNGHVLWLHEIVAELDRDALVWGKGQEVDKGSGEFPGTDVTRQAVPNVWLDLYQRERAHLVSVCKTAVACGIEERRVKLAEEQGRIIVQVIRSTLQDLGVDVTPEVASTVGRHLRVVEAA